MPLFATSVDRLQQVPERLRVLFAFDPAATLARPEVRARNSKAARAREVIVTLADDLAERATLQQPRTVPRRRRARA